MGTFVPNKCWPAQTKKQEDCKQCAKFTPGGWVTAYAMLCYVHAMLRVSHKMLFYMCHNLSTTFNYILISTLSISFILYMTCMHVQATSVTITAPHLTAQQSCRPHALLCSVLSPLAAPCSPEPPRGTLASMRLRR